VAICPRVAGCLRAGGAAMGASYKAAPASP
jgi:hypothetical protein